MCCRRPCCAATGTPWWLLRGHAGSDGDGAVVDNAAGVVHLALNGGIGFNHRRFVHHQLDDMLVAVNADVTGAIFRFRCRAKE